MIPSILGFINYYQNQEFVLDKNISIVFNGGEPLLNFTVLKKLHIALEKIGVNDFSISTNLTLLTDEIITYLYNNKFILHISLDGTKDIHNKNRIFKDGKGTFDIVYNNVVKIRKKYPDWNNSYNITISPGTVHDLYNSFRLLTDLGIRRITAAYCADYEMNENNIEIFKNEMRKISKDYIAFYENNENIYFKFLTDGILYTINNKKAACGVCKSEIAILPSGEILPCVVFVGQNNYRDYILGTLNSSLNYNKINMLLDKKLFNLSECNNCSLLQRCFVECYAVNLRVMGNLFDIPDCYCHINQICLQEAEYVINDLYNKKNKLFINQYNLSKLNKESI